MEWIDINLEKPEKEGKYVIKTKTPMNNSNTFEASCHLHDGKIKFSVTNQIVTHWLKQ